MPKSSEYPARVSTDTCANAALAENKYNQPDEFSVCLKADVSRGAKVVRESGGRRVSTATSGLRRN